MTIAYHVRSYLNANKVNYEVLRHPYSEGAIQTAISAHVPLGHMAKAVVLQDHEGRCLMAVIPSSHKVKVRSLEKLTQRGLRLAPEGLLFDIFDDCEPGAIPAIGPAYRMETYLDDALLGERDIYLECGDHESLMHMSREQFTRAMEPSHHGEISASMHAGSPYHADFRRFIQVH